MLRLLLLLPLLLIFSGCATVSTPKGEAPDPDPWEGFNRAVYNFNDKFDSYLLKPVAKGYDKVMPEPVNKGVSNFFSNLGDVLVLFNDLLQLKFDQAASDFSRIVWNSTVGLGGLIDVATPLGLEKHNEDFGQTLGYWGVGTGPYLVLPFLGPSNPRDGIGLAVDWQVDPVFEQVDDERTSWSLFALNAVDQRAGLLRASRVMEEAALDPYTFLRDAYLQRRRSLVYDGNPPSTEADSFEDELFDSLDAEPLDAPAPQ